MSRIKKKIQEYFCQENNINKMKQKINMNEIKQVRKLL